MMAEREVVIRQLWLDSFFRILLSAEEKTASEWIFTLQLEVEFLGWVSVRTTVNLGPVYTEWKRTRSENDPRTSEEKQGIKKFKHQIKFSLSRSLLFSVNGL